MSVVPLGIVQKKLVSKKATETTVNQETITTTTTEEKVPQEEPVQEIVTCSMAIEMVWPEELQKTAKAISKAENRAQNPRAIGGPNPNGSYDYGCFQYNWGYENYGEQIFDPVFNAKVAYENKYLKGGWTHWTVYKTGAYLEWL
jgi:hypothetical protein